MHQTPNIYIYELKQQKVGETVISQLVCIFKCNVSRLIDKLYSIWCHGLFFECSKKSTYRSILCGTFGHKLFGECQSKLYKRLLLKDGAVSVILDLSAYTQAMLPNSHSKSPTNHSKHPIHIFLKASQFNPIWKVYYSKLQHENVIQVHYREKGTVHIGSTKCKWQQITSCLHLVQIEVMCCL